MNRFNNFRFFLGGHDLEMGEIKTLLSSVAPGRCEDMGLAWGAKASGYAAQIAASLAAGETPVLVELLDDLPSTLDRRLIVIADHHGDRAGGEAPTSLHQIFALLKLPAAAWTRRMDLVAANDRAHVAGLQAAGATITEIIAIRAEDRAAQGITEADEAEARRAIAERCRADGFTEVTTTSNTSSAIADLMLPALGGPGYDSLLVVMLGKIAVFTCGDAIQRLAAAFPGSYWGGDLPRRGFWGMEGGGEDRTLSQIRIILGELPGKRAS